MTMPGNCLILQMREAADARSGNQGDSMGRIKEGPEPTSHKTANKHVDMSKTIDVIKDVITSTKHPFRKADSIPKKAVKNRHERRKIKEYLQHFGDWQTEEAV